MLSVNFVLSLKINFVIYKGHLQLSGFNWWILIMKTNYEFKTEFDIPWTVGLVIKVTDGIIFPLRYDTFP